MFAHAGGLPPLLALAAEQRLVLAVLVGRVVVFVLGPEGGLLLLDRRRCREVGRDDWPVAVVRTRRE